MPIVETGERKHVHVADREDSLEPLSEGRGEAFTVGTLLNIVRSYRVGILLTIVAVSVLYVIGAIAVYITSPAERVISQPFLLDFEGANIGQYPNGLKFTTSELTAPPVLQSVYQNNRLNRYLDFEHFSHSVFVFEANRDYERLVGEYQGKLADPKLTPLDRERLEREFEQKRATLSMSDYLISFAEPTGARSLPLTVAQKTLRDVLEQWSIDTMREKKVLQYRVSVLSPNILSDIGVDRHDYILTLLQLRSRAQRVLANIDAIAKIPGAELVREPTQGASLAEIHLHIGDLIRYRLEPLAARIQGANLIANPDATLRVLELQVDHDQRELKQAQQRGEAVKSAFALYQENQAATKAAAPKSTSQTSPSEMVMPQLSDTFLNRIVELTTQSADRQYRQSMIQDIMKRALDVVPAQADLDYDQQLIAMLRQTQRTGRSDPNEATLIQRSFDEVRADLQKSIVMVNEIYRIRSRYLNPATELYSTRGPAFGRTDRSLSASRLALIGLLVFLIAIPVAVAGAVLHNLAVSRDEAAPAGA